MSLPRMLKLTETIRKNLPLRISLMIGSALSLLLLVSLSVMLYFSRKAIKEDALTKASYSLEQAMTNVDNILLSVEEATGNTYWNILQKKADGILLYGKEIEESSPYISNCIIALENGSNPYKDEAWYVNAVKTNTAKWVKMRIEKDSVVEQYVSYCLPIYVPGKPALGVLRADVSLSLLSSIIADAKPSPNSYCALIDGDGSFIVHPTGEYLLDFSAFKLQSESIHHVVNSMVAGDTGYAPFDFYGHRYLVFYKPFERAYVPNRAMEDYGWSIGLAYAEEDIFGTFTSLHNMVVIIALVGIVLMYVFIRLIIRRLLRPLKMLTERTDRIAKGDFKEPIPASLHIDEVGVLQDNFGRMQKSLAVKMSQLDELTETIKERSKELQAAYKEAKKNDKMKTVFLHNMTNQMIAPANAIADDVTTLCNYDKETSGKSIRQLVGSIQQNGIAITKLLNNLINLSEQEMDEEKGGKS